MKNIVWGLALSILAIYSGMAIDGLFVSGFCAAAAIANFLEHFTGE